MLYRRVAETFPDAWLEDPNLTPETDEVLKPYRDRVTWDAVIHSVADVEGLPFPPKTVNVKPSRFGALPELFAAYDYLEERGIGAYGGGQFELGVGRGQIQALASLFHADAPNDIAPGVYNLPDPPAELPRSPLAPRLVDPGFGWARWASSAGRDHGGRAERAAAPRASRPSRPRAGRTRSRPAACGWK